MQGDACALTATLDLRRVRAGHRGRWAAAESLFPRPQQRPLCLQVQEQETNSVIMTLGNKRQWMAYLPSLLV